jgi:hypothetical protein
MALRILGSSAATSCSERADAKCPVMKSLAP